MNADHDQPGVTFIDIAAMPAGPGQGGTTSMPPPGPGGTAGTHAAPDATGTTRPAGRGRKVLRRRPTHRRGVEGPALGWALPLAARNSTRHSMRAEVLFPPELQARIDELRAAFTVRYRPATVDEGHGLA